MEINDNILIKLKINLIEEVLLNFLIELIEFRLEIINNKQTIQI